MYFVFFHRLDSFYIRTWDESIYAVNSYEMMQSGNYISRHVNGNIDVFNDKPPLFFWHQIMSFKLFGYNELGARFPSALYGAFTVILLFRFLKSRFSFLFAFCAALVLTTSLGFVTFHSSRTGEMDSMLAFGVLGMAIHFIKFKETQHVKQYLFFALFLLFSFTTKGIAALIILPIFYGLLFKFNYKVLFNVKFQLVNFFIISFILLFLCVVKKYDDSYFTANSLVDFNRFQKPCMPDHDLPFDYYYNNFFNNRFSIYVFLLLPTAFFIYNETISEIKNTVSFMFISASFFLLMISLSSSKCFWYDVPLYPLFSIVVGYAIYKLIIAFVSNIKSAFILVFLFFLVPTYYAIKRSHNNDIADSDLKKTETLSEYFHEKCGGGGTFLCYN